MVKESTCIHEYHNLTKSDDDIIIFIRKKIASIFTTHVTFITPYCTYFLQQTNNRIEYKINNLYTILDKSAT